MKGLVFVELAPDPASPTNAIVRTAGAVVADANDGAMLVRFDAGPRTHSRLVSQDEAMKFTFFDSPEALKVFMEALKPNAPGVATGPREHPPGEPTPEPEDAPQKPA